MRLTFVLLVALRLQAASPVQPTFATYLGGGGEVTGAVTTDAQGNIYLAGRTDSQDFPFSQIFIVKFSPAGDLLFSTHSGGSANDLANGIAVYAIGNIYVNGGLQSVDFPVTKAFQPVNRGRTDAYVTGRTESADFRPLPARFNPHHPAHTQISTPMHLSPTSIPSTPHLSTW